MALAILLLGFLFISALLFLLYNKPSNKHNCAWLQTFFSKARSSTNPAAIPLEIDQKSSVFARDELKQVFSTFDKNGDGFITKQELLESLKNIKIFMTLKEVDEMFVKLDTNGDGLIDFEEFCFLSESLVGQESEQTAGEESLKEAFDVFDKDKDGLISVEELGLILSALGLKEGRHSQDCREMIRKVDSDGDGMVNFAEFKKMMYAGRKFGLAVTTN